MPSLQPVNNLQVNTVVTDGATNSSTPQNDVFTFGCAVSNKPESSVVIDRRHLKMSSTMKDILLFSDDGDKSINQEFKLELENPESSKKLYFCIKVENGNNDYTFKKGRFLKFTAKDIISMKNVTQKIEIIMN